MSKVKFIYLFSTAWSLIIVFCFLCAVNAQNNKAEGNENIPRLRKTGNVTQLIVDNKPFLILGGELHNSSSSNLEIFNNGRWIPGRLLNGDEVQLRYDFSVAALKQSIRRRTAFRQK